MKAKNSAGQAGPKGTYTRRNREVTRPVRTFVKARPGSDRGEVFASPAVFFTCDCRRKYRSDLGLRLCRTMLLISGEHVNVRSHLSQRPRL